MSKAFTKDDGNDAAVVGRRRAPLPGGVPNYVTARGLRLLRDELAHLDAAAPARDPDGEPPPRVEAQALAAWRKELEERLATAAVPPAPADRAEIRFGARVRVRGADGAARDLHLVGVDEADPSAGLVAFVAPLARALLGRRAGEHATVRTPEGDRDLEIVSVTYEPA